MNDTKVTQVPRISISMSRKINLGNYESTDIFVSLASDIDDSSTIERVMEQVEKLLDSKVATLVKEKK